VHAVLHGTVPRPDISTTERSAGSRPHFQVLKRNRASEIIGRQVVEMFGSGTDA
jgi:hypothetical protein